MKGNPASLPTVGTACTEARARCMHVCACVCVCNNPRELTYVEMLEFAMGIMLGKRII
jgi:hypothetical protein